MMAILKVRFLDTREEKEIITFCGGEEKCERAIFGKSKDIFLWRRRGMEEEKEENILRGKMKKAEQKQDKSRKKQNKSRTEAEKKQNKRRTKVKQKQNIIRTKAE